MYAIRRAAARAIWVQPTTQLSVPRQASRVTQLPSIYRSFHSSRRWLADEQRAAAAQEEASPAEASTSGETVTTSPSAAEEQIKEDTLGSSSTPDSYYDAVSESSGTTGAPLGQSESGSSDNNSATSSIVDQASSLASSAASTVAAAATTVASTARSALDSTTSSAPRRQDNRNRDFQTRDRYDNPRDPRPIDANAPRVPSRILYIGNLFFEVTAPQLEAEFSNFGEVSNSRVVTDARGLSKGFAYVEFASQVAADKAVAALDQKVFQGRRMAVQYHVRRESMRGNREFASGPAVRRSNSEPTKTLFIGNMSYQMSDRDLNDLFREIRNVLDVRVAIDRRSGQPRGFAHADFVDISSAQTAKELLEKKVVYGRTLRVDYSAGNSAKPDSGAGAGAESMLD